MNAPARNIRAQERIIRIREVEHRTGLHRATIYRKIAVGLFPRQVMLGANSCGWYESELSAWLADPMGWTAAKAEAA